MRNPVSVIVINLILAVLLIGLLVGAMFIQEINDVTIEINGLSFGFSGNDYFLTSDESFEKSSDGSVTASEVTVIDLAWTAGAVNIVSSDSDTIRFSEESRSTLKDEQIMRWKVEDGTLSIRFGTKGGWTRNDPEKTLTIELPADWEAETVTIQTVSAGLSVDTLTAADLDFDSVSGGCTANSIAGKTVNLNSVSGIVRIDKIDCEKLSIDNISGEIKLRNAVVRKEVEASTVSGAFGFEGSADVLSVDTTSGNTELAFTAAGSSVEVDSTSGDVTVILPADVSGFRAEIDSTSGEITYDFNVSHRDDYIEYGDGSLDIEMDATSGDLRIRKAE